MGLGTVHDGGSVSGADAAARSGLGVPKGPDAALADVAARSTAQMAAENFPVALRLLPRGPRDGLRRAYGFARFVDDVGDEAPGDRLALLDAVEGELRAEWEGAGSSLAPVRDLRPLISAHAMPITPFLDLVEANRIDQRRTRYETFAELLDYCRYSAAPVGRIVLRLAGADGDERNRADSDAVCNALQVLEHCQDVAEDARAGRIYLPQEDLRDRGVAPEQLTAATTSPALREVVAVQVARAEWMLRAGRPLVGRLSGWSRIAVAGYLAGGEATAAALRANHQDVLARQVRPSKGRTVALLARRVVGR